MRPQSFHSRARRIAVALAFALCVPLTACGEGGTAVEIPGGAPAIASPNPTAGPTTTSARTPSTTASVATTQVAPTVIAPTVIDASGSTDVADTTPAEASITTESSAEWTAFDEHLATIIDAGSPALAATVLRDGEIVHEVALGVRTSAGDPVEVGDRFRLASISKVITAITLEILVEQGAIGLDDPVGERLATLVGVASPAAGVDQITARDLLTHRSGIGQYENLMFAHQVESCEEAAATGLGSELGRTPGTTFRYSNLNFCLLGLLIEDVTGESYDDVVRDELLTPLGIDGMRLAGTFDVQDGDVEHRSDVGRNYMEVLEGAGAWIASPTDVATIIDSIDLSTPGWKPLSADMVAQVRTISEDPPLIVPPLTEEEAATTSSTLVPPLPPVPRVTGYGMGMMVFGPESFGHTGTVESAHAMTVRQADGLTWAITVSGDYPYDTPDLAGIVSEALRLADQL